MVRVGGDEFVCAIPGGHLLDVEERFLEVGKALASVIAGASLSVGLAELRPQEALEEAIERADREMYDRRGARRNPAGLT